MIVYRYNTEQQAITAINKVNANYQFAGETKKFVDYSPFEDYFIIIFFEELRQYLGNPIQIETDNLSQP